MDRVQFLIVFGVTFAAMLHFIAAQNVYIVGDDMGWDIPHSSSVSYYPNWASGKTFSVGDVLVFNFVTNQHDLVQVTRASYDACDDANIIGSIIRSGPANVTLSTTGDHYYICTFGSHCRAGQRLAITVGSSTTPGSARPPITAPPTTPATPSPAYSQPDPCAPIPAPYLAPNAGSGPSASPARPAPPPDSASTSLASYFLLGLLCIGLALIV